MQAQDTSSAPVAAGAGEQPDPQQADFGSRGRARRRVRFLRKARELAYRDLGGLVFNLHRFGQRNDALVLNKLRTLGHIDDELRALESHLAERVPVTVLREAGITACPRCAAIHSSEDRFCPHCGLAMSRHADLPIGSGATPAGGAAAVTTQTAGAPAASTAPASAPARVPPAPAPAQAAAAPAVPAQPRAAPGPPTEQDLTTIGRSPMPPGAAAASAEPATSSGREEATEILNPPTEILQPPPEP